MAAAAGLSPLAAALRPPSAVVVLTRVLGGVVLWSVDSELDWTTKVDRVSFSRGWCPSDGGRPPDLGFL
jgi:hypothetical protein